MGNTNLPQFGAADIENSRDTLPGDLQLTDKQRERAAGKQGVGPAPGRPKNAPERIPGQQLDPDDAEDVEGGADDDEKRDDDGDVERPGGSSDPDHAADDPAAYAGHTNTGHSPSDAT